MKRDMSETMRRLRAEEERDPVEHAFLAVLALPETGRAALVARWADHHRDSPFPKAILRFDEPTLADLEAAFPLDVPKLMAHEAELRAPVDEAAVAAVDALVARCPFKHRIRSALVKKLRIIGDWAAWRLLRALHPLDLGACETLVVFGSPHPDPVEERTVLFPSPPASSRADRVLVALAAKRGGSGHTCTAPASGLHQASSVPFQKLGSVIHVSGAQGLAESPEPITSGEVQE